MLLLVRKPELFSFLIGYDQEYRTDPDPAVCSDDEQCRGFHLRGLAAEAQPRFPLVKKLVAVRKGLRHVLSVERVLALNDSLVEIVIQLARCPDERSRDIDIGNGRIFDRSVLLRSAVHADSSGRHDDISALDVEVHASAGADPDEGLAADVGDLLERDRRGRSAHSGTRAADLDPVKVACVSYILTAVDDLLGVVEIRRDLRDPVRIARQDDLFTHVAGLQSNVILITSSFCVIYHFVSFVILYSAARREFFRK